MTGLPVLTRPYTHAHLGVGHSEAHLFVVRADLGDVLLQLRQRHHDVIAHPRLNVGRAHL